MAGIHRNGAFGTGMDSFHLLSQSANRLNLVDRLIKKY